MMTLKTIVPPPALRTDTRRFTRIARGLQLSVAAGVLVVAAIPALARGDEFPQLQPGRTAVMAGSHVSCSVTATSVSCKQGTGLKVSLTQSGTELGTIRVTKGSRTLLSTVKPVRLHDNSGFVLTGSSVYCHVFVEGVTTLTCSVTSLAGSVGASGGGVPRTPGFNITDRSVVVFHYDAAGTLHVLKTFS